MWLACGPYPAFPAIQTSQIVPIPIACGLFEQKKTRGCVLGRRLPHSAASHGKFMLKRYCCSMHCCEQPLLDIVVVELLGRYGAGEA